MGMSNGCLEVVWAKKLGSEVLFRWSPDDFQIRVGVSSLVSSCSSGFLNNQQSDGLKTFKINWE